MLRTTAAGAVAAIAAAASAQVAPFTETFADAANWLAGNLAPVTYVPAGSIDGSGYISTVVDPGSIPPPQGSIVFRAHNSADASGDAFVGNWLDAGITTITFDVRHDASDVLGFYIRIATSNNFPGVAVVVPVDIAPGVWTTLSVSLDPSNPFITPEGGPGTYEATFSNVGNVQIGAIVAEGYSATDPITIDVDNFAIIPAPGSAALLGLGALAAARRRR